MTATIWGCEKAFQGGAENISPEPRAWKTSVSSNATHQAHVTKTPTNRAQYRAQNSHLPREGEAGRGRDFLPEGTEASRFASREGEAGRGRDFLPEGTEASRFASREGEAGRGWDFLPEGTEASRFVSREREDVSLSSREADEASLSGLEASDGALEFAGEFAQ